MNSSTLLSLYSQRNPEFYSWKHIENKKLKYSFATRTRPISLYAKSNEVNSFATTKLILLSNFGCDKTYTNKWGGY